MKGITAFRIVINLLLLIFSSLCVSNSFSKDIPSVIISSDLPSIALGDTLFKEHCAVCHNFKDDSIGPGLGEVTTTRQLEWLTRFISNPKKTIKSGDETATQLHKIFKSTMPSFDFFTNREMTGILSYIHANSTSTIKRPAMAVGALADPIPEKIPTSDIIVPIKVFTEIPASSDLPPKARIIKMDFQPVSKKLFAVDLRGKMYAIDKGNPHLYLDLENKFPAFINAPGLATGFGSFAFHPSFQNNGLLYTTHSEPAHTKPADFSYAKELESAVQWIITEWQTANPKKIPFEGKSREIFRIDMINTVHGVQEIAFNPHAEHSHEDYGLLYIAIGDGGSTQRGYPFLCDTNQTPWGKILRIDPLGNDSDNKKYGIPSSNPFYGDKFPLALKEIFAEGFRNPHRLSWDTKSRLYVPNIGQHNIESLHLVEKGSHSGWPFLEGGFSIDITKSMYDIFDNSLNTVNPHQIFNDPIARYDHDEGSAIAGGFEYTGEKIPALKHKFVFTDIVNGRLFYIDMADITLGKFSTIYEWKISFKGKPTSFLEICQCDKIDLRFAVDGDGELYIATKYDGKIYQLF